MKKNLLKKVQETIKQLDEYIILLEKIKIETGGDYSPVSGRIDSMINEALIIKENIFFTINNISKNNNSYILDELKSINLLIKANNKNIEKIRSIYNSLYL